MCYQIITIKDVCKFLGWGETKFYERKYRRLFPNPVSLGGPKRKFYFRHEIEFYFARSIHLASDKEFEDLAIQIEKSREKTLEVSANDFFA